MSVAEMKLEAIKKIIATDNLVVLQKVLALLESNCSNDPETTLNKKYDAIKAQYGDVLQKFAHDDVNEPNLIPNVENIVTERDEVLKKLGQ